MACIDTMSGNYRANDFIPYVGLVKPSAALYIKGVGSHRWHKKKTTSLLPVSPETHKNVSLSRDCTSFQFFVVEVI